MIPMDNNSPPRIFSSAFEVIGRTPLIRINKIGEAEDLRCEFVAKCEFFNAGGSVKDRIAKRMIEAAEAEGKLKKEPIATTIIEPTSGNTGIGLALGGALKGYPVVITLPEKMSNEKVNVLKALGAQIIRTPTEVSSTDPASHISIAKKMCQKMSNNAIILDQYNNINNPMAHYDETAMEIWRDCGGKLDMIVMGAGTGGTISGCAKRLKELNPNIIVIGVDPVGSVIGDSAGMEPSNKGYLVEGIGYDFIPDVLDRSLIDRWYKCEDKESFLMSRRLIREEGLLCGGSSGSAMLIALKAAKDFNMGEGKRVVVLLPDSVRNYMSKFLSDDWMLIHGFLSPQNVDIPSPLHQLLNTSCKEVPSGILVPALNGNDKLDPSLIDLPFLPVCEDGKIIGALDLQKISSKVIRNGPSALAQPVKRHMEKEFSVLQSDEAASVAASLAATGFPIFIVDDKNSVQPGANVKLLQARDFVKIL